MQNPPCECISHDPEKDPAAGCSTIAYDLLLAKRFNLRKAASRTDGNDNFVYCPDASDIKKDPGNTQLDAALESLLFLR
jgi:hypothetical protein